MRALQSPLWRYACTTESTLAWRACMAHLPRPGERTRNCCLMQRTACWPVTGWVEAYPRQHLNMIAANRSGRVPTVHGFLTLTTSSTAQVWDPEKIILIPDHYIFTEDERANRNVDIIRYLSRPCEMLHRAPQAASQQNSCQVSSCPINGTASCSAGTCWQSSTCCLLAGVLPSLNMHCRVSFCLANCPAELLQPNTSSIGSHLLLLDSGSHRGTRAILSIWSSARQGHAFDNDCHTNNERCN